MANAVTLAHDETWWMCKYEKEWLFVVLQWTWCLLGFLHQRWDPLNESGKSTIFIQETRKIDSFDSKLYVHHHHQHIQHRSESMMLSLGEWSNRKPIITMVSSVRTCKTMINDDGNVVIIIPFLLKTKKRSYVYLLRLSKISRVSWTTFSTTRLCPNKSWTCLRSIQDKHGRNCNTSLRPKARCSCHATSPWLAWSTIFALVSHNLFPNFQKNETASSNIPAISEK